jgi:hypothetical protein
VHVACERGPRDPNVVQLINWFGAPGDLGTRRPAWQEALPWSIEIIGFRSSFPLLALDPTQPILLVNYAPGDSTKQFLLGTLYDPAFMRVMESCKKGGGRSGLTPDSPYPRLALRC